MPICKCGAKIEFVRLLNSGKVIPVNTDYKVVIVETDKDGVVGFVTKRGREAHFASCPFANNFRKKEGRL